MLTELPGSTPGPAGPGSKSPQSKMTSSPHHAPRVSSPAALLEDPHVKAFVQFFMGYWNIPGSQFSMMEMLQDNVWQLGSISGWSNTYDAIAVLRYYYSTGSVPYGPSDFPFPAGQGEAVQWRDVQRMYSDAPYLMLCPWAEAMNLPRSYSYPPVSYAALWRRRDQPYCPDPFPLLAQYYASLGLSGASFGAYLGKHKQDAYQSSGFALASAPQSGMSSYLRLMEPGGRTSGASWWPSGSLYSAAPSGYSDALEFYAYAYSKGFDSYEAVSSLVDYYIFLRSHGIFGDFSSTSGYFGFLKGLIAFSGSRTSDCSGFYYTLNHNAALYYAHPWNAITSLRRDGLHCFLALIGYYSFSGYNFGSYSFSSYSFGSYSGYSDYSFKLLPGALTMVYANAQTKSASM